MKLLKLSFQKLRLMAGGALSIAVLSAAVFCMLFICFTVVNSKRPDSIKIAALDFDKSALSEEFMKGLEQGRKVGIKIIPCQSEREAKQLMQTWKCEGILTIYKGFSTGLAKGEAVLYFKAAENSTAGGLASEIIGGSAIKLRSALNAEKYAENLFGSPLSQAQKAQLKRIQASKPDKDAMEPFLLVNAGELNKEIIGENVFGFVYARFAGFFAFTVILMLFSLASFLGTYEAKAVSKRMFSFKHGFALSAASDYIALLIYGLIMLGFMLIIGGIRSASEVLITFVYIMNIAALSQLVSVIFASSMKANVFIPIIAFLTSLTGGCFANLRAIKSLRLLSFFTPQGLYLEALAKNSAAVIILAANVLIMIAVRLALLNAGRGKRD